MEAPGGGVGLRKTTVQIDELPALSGCDAQVIEDN
jgi:hypothetical protein